jgi:Family of unknown function (DUF6065)
MKLIAYLQGEEEPLLKPAPMERAWMDATPQRFAYRCLPLNIANAHGWEMLAPARIRAVWYGGLDLAAIAIETDAPDHLKPVSHFGSGILTFHVGCLFHTEPGYELWVTGPPNRAKHGIAPLTGVVETDWSPFTFTMNWRFTAPGEIIFEKDEPYCFFFPIERKLLTATEPEYHRLEDAPRLNAEFDAWQKARNDFNQDLNVEGSKAREEGWQRTYFRGFMPSGKPAPADHRTRQRVAPFKPLAKR